MKIFKHLEEKVTHQDNDTLQVIETTDEIKDAIFSMDPNDSVVPEELNGFFSIALRRSLK